MGDLPRVRKITARWAARAGLPPDRVGDFVLAVNEITTNAVRHGSPEAWLLLRAGPAAVVAEVQDSGCWLPATGPAPPDGGMGLPLARQICDDVAIHTGDGGTTVRLQMNLHPSRRADGPPTG